jgi:hypothetical protein
VGGVDISLSRQTKAKKKNKNGHYIRRGTTRLVKFKVHFFPRKTRNKERDLVVD